MSTIPNPKVMGFLRDLPDRTLEKLFKDIGDAPYSHLNAMLLKAVMLIKIERGS